MSFLKSYSLATTMFLLFSQQLAANDMLQLNLKSSSMLENETRIHFSRDECGKECMTVDFVCAPNRKIEIEVTMPGFGVNGMIKMAQGNELSIKGEVGMHSNFAFAGAERLEPFIDHSWLMRWRLYSTEPKMFLEVMLNSDELIMPLPGFSNFVPPYELAYLDETKSNVIAFANNCNSLLEN